MKAKFLKRSESEKSDKVKIIFEVDSADIANQLEKGQTYEIELHEPKLPNMTPSAKELLKQAQTLISQATGMIPEPREPELPFTKDGEKCANCAEWDRDINDIVDKITTVPVGMCRQVSGVTPLYHWCSYWRSNAEEDKEEGNKESAVCEEVDGEERTDSGIPESGSDQGGADTAGAEVE
jgi:hypothetical protein